jgi:hypothetical protein
VQKQCDDAASFGPGINLSFIESLAKHCTVFRQACRLGIGWFGYPPDSAA